MLHGNPLLHGWWMTDVTFYTTELPQFMLVELVAGLRPEVAHICVALTYTLLVVLAAFVARGRSRGAEGTVRALLAAGIMLAPVPGETAWALLLTPNHTGTGVPVLLLLLLLDLAPRRWYTAVAAGVLLAWSLVGDPLILVIGVLPVVVVCLARACLALVHRRVLWYEIALACAAALAVPAADAANRFLVALGGFTVSKNPATLVQPSVAAEERPDGDPQLPVPVRRRRRGRAGHAERDLRHPPPRRGRAGAGGRGAGRPGGWSARSAGADRPPRIAPTWSPTCWWSRSWPTSPRTSSSTRSRTSTRRTR